MTKYKVRKEFKNGIKRYISTPIEESEEDNENVAENATLIEEDHKDKEIARLTALVETLSKELEKLQPKEEAPSSDVMAEAAASTYSCYS